MEHQSLIEDLQRPLGYDPASMSVLNSAALLPSTAEYSTVLNLFPGNNAHAPWGTEGSFFVSITIYNDGKKIAKIHSPQCTEKGNIRLDFDELAGMLPCPTKGMMTIEYHHAKDIPVELYTTHIHRETGAYFATNAIAYMGDQLYPTVHTTQLENTLFWPGLVCNEETETQILVINPYKLTFGFQIHLFLGDGSREQSEVLRLQPFSSETYAVEDLFKGSISRLREFTGRNSICVASQYKQISYVMFNDRKTGIITTVDHLHNYCLH
jgi:hypothetical protein